MSKSENNLAAVMRCGVDDVDARALRRISMTLHRWHELECGTDSGCIERDEETGIPFWRTDNGRRYPALDRETGALKRLAKIMTRYPMLSFHVQGDPRGCALYLLRHGDVPERGDPDAYYSRGVAVY